MRAALRGIWKFHNRTFYGVRLIEFAVINALAFHGVKGAVLFNVNGIFLALLDTKKNPKLLFLSS